MYRDLGSFVRALDEAGELHRVQCEVSVDLEISAIADRVSRMRARDASSAAQAFDPAMAQCGGSALLFERVRGCDFPVLINAYGSYARTEMALGCRTVGPHGKAHGGFQAIAARIERLVRLEPPCGWRDALGKARQMAPLVRMPPRRVRRGACQEVVKLTRDGQVDLTRLPIIKCWPLDGDPTAVGYAMNAAAAGTAGGGGRFITLAGMHTIHVDDANSPRPASHNIGMYRSQLLGPTTLAMHWHMHHDGAAHWRSWKAAGKRMPIAICLGGESVMAYGATAPLPPGVSELLMCGFLNGRGIPMVRAKTVPLWVPANSEIVIEGWVSTECGGVGWEPGGAGGGRQGGERANGEPLGPGAVFEGPFGDHTGFYSLPDRYPVVEVTALTHKRQAIYPTTIVGLPPQEDYYLGKATERIFLPLLQTLVPDIVDYHLPKFGCFHNAAFVAIRKAYPLQARRVMSAIWGAGQMAWTKLILVFDADAPIHDEPAAMRLLFERCNFLRDTMSVQGPLDILDHAAPWLGAGTKLGFDCTRKMTGEGWNGVPISASAAPSAHDVEAARRAIAGACASVGAAAELDFPAIGGGRLCVVRVVAQGTAAEGAKGAAGHAVLNAAMSALDALPRGNRAAELVLAVDDWSSPHELLSGWEWHFFVAAANCDPGRDCCRVGERLGLDATRKGAGDVHSHLPTRRFPPLIQMSAAAAGLVDRRWKEYGLGEGAPTAH